MKPSVVAIMTVFAVATAGACACDGLSPKKNSTCDSPMRPWSRPFVEVRCEVWCCSMRRATELGWAPLATWWARRRRHSPWEPLMGSSTLLSYADGTFKKGRLELAPAAVLPRRDALVAGLAWSPTRQPNLTEVLEACRGAARSLGRARCLLLAIGDASFPPRGFAWPARAAAFATNVAPDAPDVVRPLPLGLSAGPSRAWARTVTQQLDDGKDAEVGHRAIRLLCRGYRTDPGRDAKLRALRDAGFRCAGDRAAVNKYWRSLKEARATFCPTGFGVATFRTYEALLAGSVPVVERYERHAPLFQELPVLQVGSLSDLTPDALDREWRRIVDQSHRRLDLRSLFPPFWIDALAAAAAATSHEEDNR